LERGEATEKKFSVDLVDSSKQQRERELVRAMREIEKGRE